MTALAQSISPSSLTATRQPPATLLHLITFPLHLSPASRAAQQPNFTFAKTYTFHTGPRDSAIFAEENNRTSIKTTNKFYFLHVGPRFGLGASLVIANGVRELFSICNLFLMSRWFSVG